MDHQTTTRLPLPPVLVLALVLLAGCQVVGVTSPPAPGQTGALTEGLDGFNSALWQKANWTNGGMFHCGFVPDNVTFSGGKMNLTLNNTAHFGKPFSSGEYRTNATFTYGTFEASLKAVKAPGTVTSFFLYTGSPWDEIDVEILGKDTTKAQFNYFVNGVGGHEKLVDLGFDASTAYHTYTIEYGNGSIQWYVDGVWKWGVNHGGPSHPMQIMVNLWPGIGVDAWLGPFSYPGPLVASYDWIKYSPPK